MAQYKAKQVNRIHHFQQEPWGGGAGVGMTQTYLTIFMHRQTGQSMLSTDVCPITDFPGACQDLDCSSADKESQTKREALSRSI